MGLAVKVGQSDALIQWRHSQVVVLHMQVGTHLEERTMLDEGSQSSVPS